MKSSKMHGAAEAAFKPRLSLTEKKHDATSRIAREIIVGDAALLDAKTQRLRAERSAWEAANLRPATTAARKVSVSRKAVSGR